MLILMHQAGFVCLGAREFNSPSHADVFSVCWGDICCHWGGKLTRLLLKLSFISLVFNICHSIMKSIGRCGIGLKSQGCSPAARRWHSDSSWTTLKYVSRPSHLVVWRVLDSCTETFFFLRMNTSWRSPCCLRESPCFIHSSCLLPSSKRGLICREYHCYTFFIFKAPFIVLKCFSVFWQDDWDCDKSVQKEAGQARESTGVRALL